MDTVLMKPLQEKSHAIVIAMPSSSNEISVPPKRMIWQAADGEILRVHSYVLMSVSEVFDAMLQSGFKEHHLKHG